MASPSAPSPPPATARSSGYKWAVVGMLWFICFFNYADRQAIYSILPVLEKDYGFNKEQTGRIAAAFMLVYAVTAPFAGQVGDRFPRKLIILSGLYVWSAITGFTALCSKVWQFVLVRGAEGLGETFYFPASMSLVSDYHSKKTRSRAMGLHQTSVYAGTVGGGWLAGWMADKYDWRAPFVLLAVAGIALGVVLAAFIREPRRNEAEQAERGETSVDAEPPQLPMRQFLAEWIRTPTAMLLVAAFLGANFVAMQFLAWVPTFLTEKFKLSLTSAGLTGTIFIQLGSMVGSVIGGVIADRWHRRRPGGRMLSQAIGVLLGAPFIFIFGSTTHLLFLIFTMSLFGICKGIYDANIWASLYEVIPPSRRAAAVGLMNMVGWLGGALGTYLMGVLVSRGLSMGIAFSSTAVIYLGASVLLVVAGLVFAPNDSRRSQGVSV